MNVPRLRFLWSAEAKEGSLHGMRVARVMLRETNDSVRRTLYLDGRALLGAFAASVVVVWIAGAIALGMWLDRNPYNLISKTDLLLPWRWSTLRSLRGQSYLAQGRDDLKAGRYADGIFRINAGLQRHPHDAASRLQIATLYTGVGQWDAAKRMMMPALDGAPPRAFLQFFFQQAERFHDHDAIVVACDRRLLRPGIALEEKRWLLGQKCEALFWLRRLELVVKETGLLGKARTARTQELRAVALCQLGRGAEAVEDIQKWTWPAAQAGTRRRLLAAAYREAGRIDDMATELERLVTDAPTDADARLFALVQWWTAGRRHEAGRMLEDFLRRFEADDGALQAAAWRCAALPAPELVARCVTSARERGRAWQELEWPHGLACLRSGDFDGFARSGELLDAAIVNPSEVQGTLRDWRRALLEAARSEGSGGESGLLTLLRERRLALPFHTDAVVGLEKSGRWPAAAAVAGTGLERFPGSVELRERHELALRKITEEAAQVPTVASAKKSRGPAATSFDSATLTRPPAEREIRIGSAEQLWRELDVCGEKGDWMRAGRLIAQARNTGATWLAEAAAELDWWEVRVAFEQNDDGKVRWLVNERLAARKLEVSRALPWVAEYRSRGDEGGARALLEIVLRRVPESGPARRLQAELGGG